MTHEAATVGADSASAATEVAPGLGPAHGAPWQGWWRIAVIFSGTAAAAFGLLAVTWLLMRPLLLLFAAIVIARALAPVVEWLARRFPRTLAVVVVYLLLVLTLGGLGWLVVPRLVEQARQLIAAAPALVDRAQAVINNWDPAGSAQFREIVLDRLNQFGGVLIALPGLLVSTALEIGLIFVMSAYWLLSAPDLHRFARSLLPPQQRHAVDRVLTAIGQTTGGYALGKGGSVLMVGVVTYVGLTVIGVDFPLVLALIAGAGELIPLVGIYLATAPAVAVALTESPTQALLVLVFYVMLQQIQNNLVIPAIMRSQAGIPPLLAIVALLAGQRLAGILGALIAIPLAGMLQVLVVHVAAPAIRRWTGAPAAEQYGAPRPTAESPEHR